MTTPGADRALVVPCPSRHQLSGPSPRQPGPVAHGAICSVKEAMSKLLPIEDAAEYLGVPVAVLRHLRARRLVPVVRFGKRIYFRPEDLDRLVEARLEPAMRGPLATLKPLRRLAP